MATKKLVKELEKFRIKVQDETPLDKVILFGSRATGKAKKDSDVDLLVVSPKFRRKKSFNRGIKLHLQWNLKYPVDFICLTPEEFKERKKEVGFIKEIVKEGIEIR